MPKHKLKPRKWNPGRPTIKGLQAELTTLRELRASDSQHMQRQHKELEQLRGGIAGAQAEVDRQRKMVIWMQQMMQHLVERR